MCVFGFVVLKSEKMTFNTCHCWCPSDGDTDKLLRNYWNHMFSVVDAFLSAIKIREDPNSFHI